MRPRFHYLGEISAFIIARFWIEGVTVVDVAESECEGDIGDEVGRSWRMMYSV